MSSRGSSRCAGLSGLDRVVDLALSVGSVLGALVLGAMSPGPSFALVAHTAMASTRSAGLAVAAGMGLGAFVFSSVVLLGLQESQGVGSWLHFAGGLYLLHFAARTWLGAKRAVAADAGERTRLSANMPILIGLFVQLSNPKTAIVYVSIFAALLPKDLPPVVTATLPPLVFVVEAGWYSVVALALSAESSRRTYLRAKIQIDRLVGGLMALLGLKLVAAVLLAP